MEMANQPGHQEETHSGNGGEKEIIPGDGGEPGGDRNATPASAFPPGPGGGAEGRAKEAEQGRAAGEYAGP